jgi:hypothetical protein
MVSNPEDNTEFVVSKMALGLIFSYQISLHLTQCLAAKCNITSHFPGNL